MTMVFEVGMFWYATESSTAVFYRFMSLFLFPFGRNFRRR